MKDGDTLFLAARLAIHSSGDPRDGVVHAAVEVLILYMRVGFKYHELRPMPIILHLDGSC